MRIWQKLMRIKGFPILLCALTIGLALLIFPFSSSGKAPADTKETTLDHTERFSAYEEELTHKIEQMAGALTGDHSAKVLLTLDVTTETVYAVESAVSGKEQYTTKYLLSNGEPVATHVVLPKVRGVAVVCRGAGDPSVRLALISMLTAAFDIPASSVYVGASAANLPDF